MFEVREEDTGELLAERPTLERANDTASVWFLATRRHAVVTEKPKGVIVSRTSYEPDLIRSYARFRELRYKLLPPDGQE